jgi:conserved hypothetical protein
MTLPSWRSIAKPHHDVLQGTFKQAEFAADISMVAAGEAPPEYQDAEQFFARTFITEGMRLLLISVAQRLAGQGGDPVIQLQTAFGGGKTHTMLAVFHLASRRVETDKLAGIPPLLDAAGIATLPQARIAVLDGINLSAAQGKVHEAITARTLWGELAWQLMGEAGYQLVAADDAAGTAPAKDTLIALLQQAAPCVVLIDELQKFFSELRGEGLAAGSFEANLKFIQALTEAFKAVPNAVLLASLPESATEAGGVFGQQALAALEKHFARVESVWKPVATEEAFEIVRRRLFAEAGDVEKVAAVCQAFCDFYRQNDKDFPPEAQTAAYFERMCRAYPLHPEVFDRLYEDWTTLEKFQRTRGVLQYLAVIIHRLWNSNNQDALIMPGSLPLYDGNVRDKSIQYLPEGWQPVLEKEVDGERSIPSQELDGKDTRFGSVQAAQRVMRTIFLGSAPEVSTQHVRGLRREQILLGSVQPGVAPGVFVDALARLRDQLHYLNADNERYWLDTRPNLRREMESRSNAFASATVIETIRQQLEKVLSSSSDWFEARHVFTPAADIPDDYGRGLRLVVLPPAIAYTRQSKEEVFKAAAEILDKRGNQPRQKRNRLLFLAADGEMTPRLYSECRSWLAWQQIVSDIDSGKMNLDLYQAKQARLHKDNAADVFKRLLRDTYRWLLNPVQDDAEKQEITWEAGAISTNSANMMQEIENRVREEEWAVKEWSPLHLRDMLEKWYFKNNGADTNALKVYQDTCRYLYLPRLLNDGVFKDAINKGLASQDFFAFAYSKKGDKYEGFTFGKDGIITLDENSLLIARATAQAYAAQLAAERAATTPTATTTTSGSTPSGDSSGNASGGAVPAPAPTSTVKTHFYAATALDPVMAKKAFNKIADEIIQQFTTINGMNVQITLDIQVECADGFDKNLQRAVCENCRALEIKKYEFE